MLTEKKENAADFNSRPREGANRKKLENLEFLVISIPAPARGRTSSHLANCETEDFNSRPREGANRSRLGVGSPSGDFNSRPREGANMFSALPLLLCSNFNSRPREGANKSSRTKTG